MKRLYILFALIFTSSLLFAQFPGGAAPSAIVGKISGIIIDSVTQKPIDYATISLSRSTQTKSTNGSLADERGIFKIENVRAGRHRITISFIGYETKIIDPVETTLSKPDFNLGTIKLSPNNKMLNEVTVVGEAAIIENKIFIVFNVIDFNKIFKE